MNRLKHFETPTVIPPGLGGSMFRAFDGIVGITTSAAWAEDLFRYDPFVVEIVTGHFAGTRRPNHHVIHYKDHWSNILTYIIELN